MSVPRLGLVVITARDAESSVRIFAVGILRRGGKSLTWYRRYSVSSIHILENPPSEEELRAHAGAAGDVPSLRNQGLLSAASATELLVALEAARPEVSETVSMAARYSRSAVDSGGDEVLTPEEIGRYRSDAGILSMRMRGFTLEQIREITPRTRGSLEEHLMRVDQEWFAGLQSQFGERPEFRIFDHPKGELTVIDSNHHRMERMLGVDLIYCCTWNRSLVLVQYKKMRRKNGRWRYYSDDQFDKEIDRMRTVPVDRGDEADHPDDYRLASDACYFKFVTDDDWNERESHQLLPGMYLPLNLAEILLRSPSHVTEAGRLRLVGRPDANVRYLNNTLFEDLFQGGWIGSTGFTSEQLDEQLQATYELNHSLIFAVDDRPGRPVAT